MKSFLIGIFAIFSISATMLLNIYALLNITEDQAKERLSQSIVEGRIMRHLGNNDLVSGARKLSTDEQVEGIRQLMQMAKEYTATEAFQKDYKKLRNEKLNPGAKSKLGIPKLGKIIENKIDNKLDQKKNEINYPAEASEMIKKRLTDFLEISATVDFDAQLEGSRFVNPEYEKKDGWWKMCFRAGKSVITAAREEAQKWLDELKSK